MIKVCNKTKIIVSLTSYPKRIHIVHKVIDCMLQQTLKADMIILWLAENEFPGKESSLPKTLLEQKNQGLTIRWCEDLKPHKKYLYAMKQYPNDIIITVDDDVNYDKYLIERLFKMHIHFPEAVIAGKVHYITIESSGVIRPYNEWILTCNLIKGIPSMDLFAVGSGGILYPPYCMDSELLNKNKIIEYSLYVDDVWLKFMQILKGTPVVWAETEYKHDITSEGLYCTNNANGGNDIAIKKLQEIYSDRVKLKRDDELYERFFLKPKVDLLERIDNMPKIAVYGAGLMAHEFLKFLKSNLQDKSVDFFVVSDKVNNPTHIEGIPVVELNNELSNDCHLIVATTKKYHPEVLRILNEKGIENRLLITNDICDLMKLQ